MIERKNKFIRIRVIGGSGIFDSIINILKKPIVSKQLVSAGKSAASALGERLVNRMIAPALPMVAPALPMVAPATAVLPPQPVVLSPQPVVLPPALSVTQQPSSRAQELISRYSAKQAGTGVTMRRQAVSPLQGSSLATGGAITIQEYIKSYKGAGIKLI